MLCKSKTKDHDRTKGMSPMMSMHVPLKCVPGFSQGTVQPKHAHLLEFIGLLETVNCP